MKTGFTSTCPLPYSDTAHVAMAHGGGGLAMHRLLEKLILPAFQSPLLDEQHDGAVIDLGDTRIAFSTDSYVVRPLFFPGGDIGSLAINGTVNDLAMCGARPRWLSAAFIIEEGLPMETLERVVQSMQQAAHAVGAELVTGDTKVVDKGKGDGLFINTAGIGIVEHYATIAPAQVRSGDAILLSGDIGRHGIAIMSAREGLEFENVIESDCAPLAAPVLALIRSGIDVHCLRDLTRGGLATALNEISRTSGLAIQVDDAAIPVREEVRGACELLGLDPLYVANEGRFIAFVPPERADAALAVLRADAHSAGACQIGFVHGDSESAVTIMSRIGTLRILDMLSGEQLPRIC